METVSSLMMGNQAIVRGAVEAGVKVAAGYPGTPSSEIIDTLSKTAPDIYTEWSVNEKIALEVAAAGSFAGLRSLAVMKQPGVNVAADFLMHLALSGTRAGMVLVAADDPGALSSINEGDTRLYSKLMGLPLLEPGNFQEACDMTKWAFELSEELKSLVILRTVTRLSHASGNVITGRIKKETKKAYFEFNGNMLDPMAGIVTTIPVSIKHSLQHEKLRQAGWIFENSGFNTFEGPENPELLIITTSICDLYAKEAVDVLKLDNRVAVLKLGTTWPLPSKLIQNKIQKAGAVLFIEEIQPFIEENIKVLSAGAPSKFGEKTYFGKLSNHIPMIGEVNPDLIIKALQQIFNLEYQSYSDSYKNKADKAVENCLPEREIAFCPGCPHRASFFTINKVLGLNNQDGFTCGDIGCYSLGILPGGFSTIKTLHAMGSGTGLASGFGKLSQFGMEQPVISVCGDSTFFHSAIPPLINAVHNESNLTMVILDNSGTAMTGFQPHPGLLMGTRGEPAPGVEIADVCRAIGAKTKICDPFDLEKTEKTLLEFIEKNRGVNVLILKQICALSPEKKGNKLFNMSIDKEKCIGEECGCNRICTRVFSCPALIWNKKKNSALINDILCTGCGVCAEICPADAILREKI